MSSEATKLVARCAWRLTCTEHPTRERWDAIRGGWTRVCEKHSRDASPFELRELGAGDRA